MGALFPAKPLQEKQKQRKASRLSRSTGNDSTKKNTNDTHKGVRSTTAPTSQANPKIKESGFYARTKAERAARNANDARRLAAVSGVVIPSKVPLGQQPDQGKWEEVTGMILPCSICGRKFRQKHQVRVHMAACAERNGNPHGARWDDAWSDRAISAGNIGAQSSDQDVDMEEAQSGEEEEEEAEDEQPDEYQQEDYESEYYHPAHHKFPKSLFDTPRKPTPVSRHPLHHNPHSASPASPSSSCLDQSHSSLSIPHSPSQSFPPSTTTTTTPSSASENIMAPYDANILMDRVTNKALLSMLEAWQELMACGLQGYRADHPHLQAMIRELRARGIIREDGTWSVAIEMQETRRARVVAAGSKET